MNVSSWLFERGSVLPGRPDNVPVLPWPSRVRVPDGWTATVTRHGDHLNAIVESDSGSAVAVIDVVTREILVSAKGSHLEFRRLHRQQALRLAADSCRHEDSVGPSRESISYVRGTPATWTDMQVFAQVTGGYWFPPLPEDERPEIVAGFEREAITMNRLIRRTRYAPARAQYRARLRAARSSQGPARPARPGPAAG